MSNKNWESFPKPTDEQLKLIITDPGDAKSLVEWAERIGNALARQLTTNQIRAIFGEVRRIEGEWKNPNREKQASQSLMLLKPKMAYRAKKERGRGVEDLVSVLSPAIDYVGESRENFMHFVEFFEAILAYHRAYGGS
jgi:CRISPR-associated protein Csm2